MKTLSSMICHARKIIPTKGQIIGICVYCGNSTIDGHSFKPTGQFTTYQHIQGGTCICPECNVMKLSQDYRRSMWWVNGYKYCGFKQNEAKYMLQNPPKPPFVMYMTKTWKKQGWPQLVTRINESKEYFIVGFDYELVIVESKKRDECLQFAQELMAIGITKPELLTGNLKHNSYTKLNFDLYIINRIQSYINTPLWDLCVYVTRNKYDK